MIFKCSKDKLIDGMSVVVKAISSHSTMSILACVLVEADDSGLKLTATDLDTGIEVKNIEAEVIEQGALALEAKIFFDIVRRMPDDIIHISTDSKNITVLKCGKTEFKILGLDAEEFPELPVVQKNNGYILKCSDIKNIVRQTLFAVAVDESKPVLTGALFEIKEEELNVVAVDGVRVAVKVSPIVKGESVEDDSVYAVIPAKALNELSKIIPSDSEDMVLIYFTDKHVLFEMNKFLMVSRLLEGEFIKYQQVFNEDSTTVIYVNRQDFLFCMERAMLITSKDVKKNPVFFRISENVLSITSRTETGTSFDELSIEMEGSDIEISFNPKYLSDVARVIEEDELKMQFTSSLSPCTVRGRGNEDYKYLLLPLRIKM